jgi:hypothetical protein
LLVDKLLIDCDIFYLTTIYTFYPQVINALQGCP